MTVYIADIFDYNFTPYICNAICNTLLYCRPEVFCFCPLIACIQPHLQYNRKSIAPFILGGSVV